MFFTFQVKKVAWFFFKHGCFAMFTASFSKNLILYYDLQSAFEFVGEFQFDQFSLSLNPIWTGGGAKCPPEGFSKFLKNGLANLHQT